jgi:hypothetical protein
VLGLADETLHEHASAGGQRWSGGCGCVGGDAEEMQRIVCGLRLTAI